MVDGCGRGNCVSFLENSNKEIVWLTRHTFICLTLMNREGPLSLILSTCDSVFIV